MSEFIEPLSKELTEDLKSIHPCAVTQLIKDLAFQYGGGTNRRLSSIFEEFANKNLDIVEHLKKNISKDCPYHEDYEALKLSLKDMCTRIPESTLRKIRDDKASISDKHNLKCRHMSDDAFNKAMDYIYRDGKEFNSFQDPFYI